LYGAESTNMTIRLVSPEQYSKVKSLLFDLLGVASFESLHQFDVAANDILVCCTDNFKDCMVIFRKINVLIVTSSKTVLEGFLKKLGREKGYAFRCPEWMAPTVLKRFPPKEAEYKGVVLLTYATSRNDFKKHSNVQFNVRILCEDNANEVTSILGDNWSPESIRERIKKGLFYGVYEGNKPISWLGTIWESDKACEIGFAYTREGYRGKGLMKTLTSFITGRILEKGKIPILHTVETNTPAIKIAESLGYGVKAREWAYFYNL